MHYAEAIRLHGSLDGYNTEWSERLHIEFAKKGYRASNHINYTSQMTSWMRCREAVAFFQQYVNWVVPPSKEATPSSEDMSIVKDGVSYAVAKVPPWPAATPATLKQVFGCVEFIPTLQAFLTSRNIPYLRATDEDTFSVFTCLMLKHTPSTSPLVTTPPNKTIHAGPLPYQSSTSTPHFDTVLSLCHTPSSTPSRPLNLSGMASCLLNRV
jgi:hypothetical protein